MQEFVSMGFELPAGLITILSVPLTLRFRCAFSLFISHSFLQESDGSSAAAGLGMAQLELARASKAKPSQAAPERYASLLSVDRPPVVFFISLFRERRI